MASITSSVKSSEGILVNLKGASQMEGEHMFDFVVDTTNDTWIPWAKQHHLTDVSIRYDIEREFATGFLHIDNEIENFIQVCPKEMLDKLYNPISLKPVIKEVS